MTKNVTIKDIAAEAGVSIALVSFVMNNRTEPDGRKKYRVSEATRDKILEVARRLEYQPNPAARTLRKGKSRVIGAVFSDISNVFYGEIAREMEDLAFRHGYTVLIGSTDELPEKLDNIVSSFIDKGVDGFIVVPCEGSEKSIGRILRSNIPLVFLDRRNMDLPAPKVVLDNRDAMRNAVRLLEESGARDIEMLSFTMRVSSIVEREEGFMSRMSELGFTDCDRRIHRIPFHNQMGYVQNAIADICSRGVDGLVFATNYLTISS
ncbi:MAG: LacI family transcriptional regulator, partial [Bacteroidales bacterium]|nr:LacI family transcriptional regulator [Bacteroidales bacterium]